MLISGLLYPPHMNETKVGLLSVSCVVYCSDEARAV